MTLLATDKVTTVLLNSIPMPPSVNNYYKTVVSRRSGKIIRAKDTKAVQWENAMLQWGMCTPQVIQARQLIKQLRASTYLEMNTDFWFRRSSVLTLKGLPKRNDTSNRIKPLQDKLCELLGIDDCWIWNGTFRKNVFPIDAPECCSVELRLLIL